MNSSFGGTFLARLADSVLGGSLLALRVEDTAHTSDPPELSGKSGELQSWMDCTRQSPSSRLDTSGRLCGLLFGRKLARVTEQRLVLLHDN